MFPGIVALCHIIGHDSEKIFFVPCFPKTSCASYLGEHEKTVLFLLMERTWMIKIEREEKIKQERICDGIYKSHPTIAQEG